MPEHIFVEVWDELNESLREVSALLIGAICVRESRKDDARSLIELVHLASQRVEEAKDSLELLLDRYREAIGSPQPEQSPKVQ